MSDARIIGGMFGLGGLPGPGAGTAPFLRGGETLLLTARCALWLALDRLAPPQTWMPSYLCGFMLDAVDRKRTRVRFYPIAADLSVADDAWLAEVGRGDAVVLIDYFGFPADGRAVVGARARGAWVIEDACQALLSGHVGQAADLVCFSPRKFVGVPDGGILRAGPAAPPVAAALAAPPQPWWLKALEAAVLRREFDRHNGGREWFRLFRETEAEFPVGPYAMSELAAALLRHGFDYAQIARRRRENYAALAARLGDLALFPALPPDVVPLGFPARVPERDRVRRALFEREIYPPVHWDLSGCVPAAFADSHRLSREILTLPCDQRCDEADMERMASALREAAAC